MRAFSFILLRRVMGMIRVVDKYKAFLAPRQKLVFLILTRTHTCTHIFACKNKVQLKKISHDTLEIITNQHIYQQIK